jgi:hypothetical protein
MTGKVSMQYLPMQVFFMSLFVSPYQKLTSGSWLQRAAYQSLNSNQSEAWL